MKNLLLILFIIPASFYSQVNYRFIYDYKSINDSLNIENVKKEMYFLDILEHKSIYYNNNDVKRDSLLSRPNESAIASSDIIEKNISENKILQTTKISENTYLVNDNRKLRWKIFDDHQEILNYKCQRATLNFAGRKWEAWFTNDIPIQDGPYKFYGLPGLIIKIEDESNSHSFQLVAIEKNLKNTYPNKEKGIPITYEKYIALYKQINNDPTARLRQNPIKVSENSSAEQDRELMKNMEKFLKNRTKKNNNILELDLIK